MTVEQVFSLFLGRLASFFTLETWIILSPAIISILFATCRNFGILDVLTGRDHVIQGIERLKNTAGYPINFIYSDKSEDEKIFKELYKRIKKRSKEPTMSLALEIPHQPIYITTAGSPLPIFNVDPQWPQSARFYYSSNHPVLYVFKIDQIQLGKAVKVCTIGDFENWLRDEKEKLDFWVGSIILGILSIVLIIIRLAVNYSS